MAFKKNHHLFYWFIAPVELIVKQVTDEWMNLFLFSFFTKMNIQLHLKQIFFELHFSCRNNTTLVEGDMTGAASSSTFENGFFSIYCFYRVTTQFVTSTLCKNCSWFKIPILIPKISVINVAIFSDHHRLHKFPKSLYISLL